MAFSYYSPITINAGQVPSAQADFPILISVTDSRFKTVANGGHVGSANGYDIRPYSDSGLTTAIIGYELERYNASTGEVIMWIKRSSVVDGLITYLAYGDSSLIADGSSATTWSNSFMGVYHLGDGTTLNVNSSTGLNNGTNHGVTATTGQIDGAGGFAFASSQYVDCGTGMNPAAATISAWVKATSFPNAYNTIGGINGSTFIELYAKSTGKLACYVSAAAGTVSYDGTGSHTLLAATWYYLTMIYDLSSGLIGYINAVSDGTATQKGAITVTGDRFDIGQDAQNAGRFWSGVIDEVRFANVARSADWITTEYKNQFSPSTFETLGDEVSTAPAPQESQVMSSYGLDFAPTLRGTPRKRPFRRPDAPSYGSWQLPFQIIGDDATEEEFIIISSIDID